MVDSEIVLEKLRHIRAALDRIREKNPRSQEALFGNPDTQDIVLRNIQNALQGCMDIASHVVADEGWGPAQKAGDFFVVLGEHKVVPVDLAKRMVRLIKFRNILVHEYTRLDADKTWTIVNKELSHIEAFCRAVTRLLDIQDETK